ncbi:DEAD/DEAH box helicase [Nonomuraea typhae]|uniref:DEAD/DEAH box helicase n=1 Tax=Nonomuraea typhae TaxID=2603600 RepID=A0ABW7YJ55_9ACTN
MLTLDLHLYQEEAVTAFIERGNMLLAFDMGLGKTLTSIGAAEELLGQGEIDQTLIVVPSGLKLQWAAALATRTDMPTQTVRIKGEFFEIPEEQYCVVVDGSPQRRRQQYAMIKELKPQYVIAGYRTVISELRTFKRMKPGMVVLDEATVIKSPAAEVTRCIRELCAPYRMALTGTPVDKELEDLFHIMAWVDEDLLGDFRYFDQAYIERDIFGQVKRYKNTDLLHRKVAPALIRKRSTDPDVAPYMPRLRHERWAVQMDARTAEAYRRVAADLAKELAQLPARGGFDVNAHYSGIDENTSAGRVMAVHIAAQQLLTEPELLFDSETRYAKRLVDEGVIDGLLSAKRARLDMELSRILADESKKVVLVTRWRGVVDRLANIWPGRSVTYHGGLSPAEKQSAVNRFQDDADTRLFIMSHAGAYGVDLPAANVLINLDPARSPGQRDQINHRHVRAGSTNAEVIVADLVTEGTVEERAYDRLDLRGRVARAVVDGKGAKNGEIENDVQSLTAHVHAVLEDVTK